MIKATIPLAPRTKKNSMQITKNGVIQSKAYLQYEKDCKYFVKWIGDPIDYPVNIKAVYYMDTHRKVDLVNLHSALHDVLVKYGLLADDNSKIVYSTDGSYVDYDKENSRTEITITEV